MYLLPRETALDTLTNESGSGNTHNSSAPQLKPFPSHFSSKEKCAHSNPGELNRNKI